MYTLKYIHMIVSIFVFTHLMLTILILKKLYIYVFTEVAMYKI